MNASSYKTPLCAGAYFVFCSFDYRNVFTGVCHSVHGRGVSLVPGPFWGGWVCPQDWLYLGGGISRGGWVCPGGTHPHCYRHLVPATIRTVGKRAVYWNAPIPYRFLGNIRDLRPYPGNSPDLRWASSLAIYAQVHYMPTIIPLGSLSFKH